MEVVMNYLKKLSGILQKEYEAIEMVFKLENEKYDALRSVDVKKIMELNSQEEGILEVLTSTEKKRKEIVVNLSKEFNLERNLSLTEIIKSFEDKVDASIINETLNLKEKIKHLSEKLKVVVRENEELIKSNLEIITFTLGFVSKQSLYETYNHRKKGEPAGVHLVNNLA